MKTERLLLTTLMLAGVVAGLAVAAEQTSVFDLEEFSVFDAEGPLQRMLGNGQYVRDCGDEPDERVKTYPALKSNSPAYGSVAFGIDLLGGGSGQVYCFVLDESGQTGAGYDRLYFDANHDFDLSNDPVLKPAQNPPAGMQTGPFARNSTIFASVKVCLVGDGNETSPPVTVWPRVLSAGSRTVLFFVAPAARRGKIALGSKAVDLILAQSSVVTGRYNHPATRVFIDNQPSTLLNWPCSDGTFYRILPTPAGDKVTVRPYDGGFGSLEVLSAGGASATVERGMFRGKGAIIDVSKCRRQGRRLSLPVGDYRPYYLSLQLGRVRATIQIKTPGPREKAPSAVFGLKVRADEPCVFKLDQKPEVVFQTPKATDHLEAGQEVQVKAVMCDPAANLMLRGLDDVTRKVGEPMKLPDGSEYQRYESIDPVIKITNAAGATVAQGKMPFG